MKRSCWRRVVVIVSLRWRIGVIVIIPVHPGICARIVTTVIIRCKNSSYKSPDAAPVVCSRLLCRKSTGRHRRCICRRLRRVITTGGITGNVIWPQVIGAWTCIT